jgi:predicted nucleotidyltransferase
MPDALTEIIVNELKSELKEKYPDFRGIYLFGSRARGDEHKDSDYDIAIIFDRKIDWRFDDKIMDSIINYEIKYDLLFDYHVFNFNDILEPITPFRNNVRKEGIFYAV